MAVVGSLHKIVWGGTLATTETWSCGVHFLNPNPGILDETLIKSAIGQWMARSGSNVGSSAVLNYLKVNEIDPVTGKYADTTRANTYPYEPAIVGLGGSNFPQLALAVSTRTALSRGRGSKGRFFQPIGGGVGVGSDGKMLAEVAMAVAVSGAQLLTDLNGAQTGECVVFSRIGQVTAEILGVRVGRVIDTQQRRRRSLTEDYQSANIS